VEEECGETDGEREIVGEGEEILILCCRYKCLCAKMIGKEKVSDEVMCDYLCKALTKMKMLDDRGWQKGKSKIFLRDAQVLFYLLCFY
jgi:myosin heavy subunit